MFLFFRDTTTTALYTLSLHDALPICEDVLKVGRTVSGARRVVLEPAARGLPGARTLRGLARLLRSEEHTSELQSRRDLVCRLLLEKKKARFWAGCRLGSARRSCSSSG